MKKILTIIIILIISTSGLFASSISALAQGGAVLTARESRYAFDYNIANLSAQDWVIELPVSASIYNASTLADKLLPIDTIDSNALIETATDLLYSLNGEIPLVTADESLLLAFKGLGLYATMQERIKTIDGSANLKLRAEVESKVALGFAHTFNFGRNFSLSAGLAASLNATAKTNNIGAADLMSDDFDIYSALDISIGVGVSLDFGLLAELPGGFSLAVTADDINVSAPFSGISLSDNWSWIEEQEWAMNMAVGWSGRFSIFSLRLEAGLRDVLSLENEVDLMKSFNAGMALGITKFLNLYAGLNGGYPSLGLEFDILCFTIGAAWYYQDFGEIYGLNPRDVLTIEISLSFN